MVTPNTTPRKSGVSNWQDDVGPSIPRATAVKFRADQTNMSVVEMSAVDMLGGLSHERVDPWVTSTSSAIAPKHRSVIPLPSTLSKEVAHVAVDVDGSITFANPADLSIGLRHKEAASAVLKSTFSSQRKHASPVSRGRLRPHSSHHLSGFHVESAECCGYKHPQQHSQQPQSSKVFVTFCELSLQEQVAEAQNALQKERDHRESDAHLHQVETIKILRQLKAVEAERDQLAANLATLSADHQKNVKEGTVIRNEFERRWKESEALREKEATELASLRLFKQKAELDAVARAHLAELEQQQLNDVKLSLGLSQKESAEHARRAQTYFEELSIARKTIAALEKELAAVRDILAARDAIVRGMEKELASANDKLSSIAVLRNSFQSSGKQRGGK